MKTILRIFLIIIFIIFLLISCYEFLSIEQPDLADRNSIFEVPITVALAEEEGGINCPTCQKEMQKSVWFSNETTDEER